jgi:hypothetical protein
MGPMRMFLWGPIRGCDCVIHEVDNEYRTGADP